MLLVIWFGYGFTSAVHQFIAQEALDYYNRITSDETYNVSDLNIARSGFMTGSTDEDSFDIIYGYGQSNSPSVQINDLEWPLNDLVSNIISEDPSISTTITHFWDSDNPVSSQTISHAEILNGGEFSLGPVPTADTKARHIIRNSSDEPFYKRWYFRNPALSLTFVLVDGSGNVTVNARQFSDDPLDAYDMYEYKILSMDDFLLSHNLKILTNAHNYAYVHLTDEQFSTYIRDTPYNPEFNILGRLCHLLMDMCVPAHVHSDAHNPTITMDGIYMANDLDNFEGWGDSGSISAGGYLSDDTDELTGIWEADNVEQAHGLSLIPIQQNQDDYYYLDHLFYTVNQITQFFASEDVDGNTQFSQIDHTYLLQMMTYLQGQQAIDPDFVAVTQSIGVSNNCEESVLQRRFDKMRDILIPLSIRATSTLISWWGLRYGRHDDIAESVTINFDIDNVNGNTSVVDAPIVRVRDHNDRSIEYGVYYLDNSGSYTINFPNPGLNNTITTDVIIETAGFHPIINYNVPISCPNTHGPISINIGPYFLEPLTSLGLRVKRTGTYNTFLWVEDAVNYALDNAFTKITLEPGEYDGPISILIPDNPGMIDQSLEITGRYNDRSTILKLTHLQYNNDHSRTLVRVRSGSGSACIGEIVFRDIEFRGVYSQYSPQKGIELTEGCAEEFKLINCALINFRLNPDLPIVTDGIALYSAVDTYIDSCIIHDNRGSEVYWIEDSRGVICILANAIITNSEISNNRSGTGAIYCDNEQGSYRFENNTFRFNSAYRNYEVGSAIQCHHANTIDIIGNLFVDNGKFDNAYGAGAVIDIHPSANVKIASNTLVTTANSAFPGLNAIELSGSTVHVDNNIITKFDKGLKFDTSPSNVDVLKNDIFWGNINNYPGLAYNTQANTGHCLFEDPHLSDTFTPLWNESFMSPCIDNGTGVNDPDGTPPDIGAKRAIPHQYWEYSFTTQADLEKWYWVSYPVLNSRTNGMLKARDFFEELLLTYQDDQSMWHPTFLDEIDWLEGGGPYPTRLYWDVLNWSNNQNIHNVSSPQGYKIKMLSRTPSVVTLKESGFRTPSDLQFPIFGETENWLGYFKEEPAWPHEAFASIWDDINMIKTKNWCLVRANPIGDYWGLHGKVSTLNYGDMVIVTTNNDHTFQWNNTDITEGETKGLPEHFVFNEKQDYIPVYVTLPDSLLIDLKEIGIYLDGVCKGAVVIENSVEQISTYLDINEKLSDGVVEFVFYYNDNKSQHQERRTIRLDSSRFTARYVNDSMRHTFYDISITKADMDNVVTPDFSLSQNYPNPFNPTTTISYQLPESGCVRLVVYNLRGQIIKILVEGNQESGFHSVVWNGTDINNHTVASGVYFYRLSSTTKTSSKRMLLLK